MDKIEQPVTLPCSHIFCTECIVNFIKYTKGKSHCPSCRSKFELHNVIQIKNKSELEKKSIDKLKEKKDKDEVLFNLIQSQKDSKIVVFSNFNKSFDIVLDKLKKVNIKYYLIKGSNVESIIKRFNNGDIPVLFLNSKYCGAGIDLSSATDLVIYHR